MRHLTRTGPVLTAALAALAMTAAACGGGGSGSDGKITLTVATFNEFGYEQLLKEYEASHPNIRIQHRKAGQSDPHHQNLVTKLAAGSGLSDVEAVEEGRMAETVLKFPEKFNDLSEIGPDVNGRWVDWKFEAGKKDGKLLGYGTDIGPMTMCYRKDLFQQAGLPTDPAEVGKLFATWDSYFATGQRFKAKMPDVGWFDSGAQIFNAMHNQLPEGYYNKSGELVVATNPGIKQNWDKVTTAIAQGQSAGLVAWSPAWQAGFKNSQFATKTCPSWMLGPVRDNSGEALKGKWELAAGFPGGGGNWGGSYLTVPKQSKHPKEAAELAAWLTAPEQQVKAFQGGGGFPSQVAALEDPATASLTNPYFPGTPVGKIYVEQAKKNLPAQFKGEKDGAIQDRVISNTLGAIEQKKMNAEQGWQTVLDEVAKLTD